MAQRKSGEAPLVKSPTLTFADAVGRVFEFNSHSVGRKRFYVVRYNHIIALTVDLDTSEVVHLWRNRCSDPIPSEWKEILP